MEKKIIEYGTQHQVKVLSANDKLITVVDENGEGYLLVGHGIKELPKEGDKGKITFVKSNTHFGIFKNPNVKLVCSIPFNGHWSYESIKN